MSPWTGPVVVLAVLAAAVLHASWNALVKATDDQVGIFARSSLVGAVICAVGLWFVDMPAAASWGWLIASALIHVAYNLGLLAAYQIGRAHV